jgi:hypothetical protein
MAQQKSDPEAIVDFRTPRFDLDNMYGLLFSENSLQIEIRDNGSGFNAADWACRTSSNAPNYWGGDATVNSTINVGTHIIINTPYA